MKELMVPAIPAVDLLAGEAVRLERGAFDRVVARAGDPAALVRRLAASHPPFLHVVDLAAARSGGVRPDILRDLVAAADGVPVQASGGVRSVGDALALLEAGAARVVVGTAAFASPDALPLYAEALGERLVVAVDVREGQVAIGGWETATALGVNEAVARCLAAGVPRLLCTAIDRDGTLGGPDLELLRRVVELAAVPVLAAGGVRDEDDLRALARIGVEAAVVGRSLLEGGLSLGAAPRPRRTAARTR